MPRETRSPSGSTGIAHDAGSRVKKRIPICLGSEKTGRSGLAVMILLDTNYLIRVLVANSKEAGRVSAWLALPEQFSTSAIAWYEVRCGPVDDEGVAIVRDLVGGRIIPFSANEAAEAARLWNETGRSRKARIDAMIAATALVAGASLATENSDDFRVFTEYGVRLV
jgi:predicted nucleic acid-binding protein